MGGGRGWLEGGRVGKGVVGGLVKGEGGKGKRFDCVMCGGHEGWGGVVVTSVATGGAGGKQVGQQEQQEREQRSFQEAGDMVRRSRSAIGGRRG